MVNFNALTFTAIMAPWLAAAKPLLPVPGSNPLKPSPLAFNPDSLNALADALPSAEASADVQKRATDLATDQDMYVFKRRPSDLFRREADAHIADMHARLRQKRALGLTERYVLPEQYVGLEGRQTKKKATCLAATADQDDITAAFLNGGAGTRVALCPGVTYSITDVIYFTAANQELYTLGYPTDNTRATIAVTGAAQSVALYAGFNECANVAVRNVAFNGNRPTLGRLPSGAGLLEIGGSAGGQVVSGCKIFEPRGWSALHVAEGAGLSCTNSNLINNQIGPAGDSPNSAYQFNSVMAAYAKIRSTPGALQRRDVINPGQWADGISLACASSTVRGNTITDATDGAIVIFGSPSSTISSNTIVSNQRVALGGINLVDKWPWGGSYDGVSVVNNKLYTQGSMIKVGIAMGPMVWGVYNQSDGRTWGGLVKGNTFSSSPNGYFGFGIGTAGHFQSSITGNTFSAARFNYATSYACFPQWLPPPAGPLVRDPKTTNGTFQAGTVTGDIVLLVCVMPCEYSTAGCTWNGNSAPAPTTATAAGAVNNAKVTKSSSSSSSAAAQQTLAAAKTKTKSKSVKATQTSKTNEWTAVYGKAKAVVGDFVDDRPPFSYGADDKLDKSAERILPDVEFHEVHKRSELNDSDVLLPGFGRSVYEKEALVEANFLAPLES